MREEILFSSRFEIDIEIMLESIEFIGINYFRILNFLLQLEEMNNDLIIDKLVWNSIEKDKNNFLMRLINLQNLMLFYSHLNQIFLSFQDTKTPQKFFYFIIFNLHTLSDPGIRWHKVLILSTIAR